MKSNHFLRNCLLLAGAVAVGGCDQQPKPASNRDMTGADLPERVTNAAAATRAYAFEAKERATESLQKGLADMDAKIDELAKKSANYTGQAKARADDALGKLREERDVAARKLDELKAAGKEKWQEVQTGFDTAWQKLKDTYAQVKDEFHE